MDSALFGLSLLPTWVVVISGLFFWIPGELFIRLAGGRIVEGRPACFLLGQLPALVALLSIAQLIVGHLHVSLSLISLAAATCVGLLIRNWLVARLRWIPSWSSRPSLGDSLINVSFIISLYVGFLYLIWWLPAGIRGVWVWPLQFEPESYSFFPWLISFVSISALLISRWKIERHRLDLALIILPVASALMQVAAWLSQSVSLIQIYTLDKITGYYSASRVFSSISDLFLRFNESLPGLPYHVVSHPIGKVLVFKLSSQVFDAPGDLFAVRVVIVIVSSCSSLLVWHLAWRLWRIERSALIAGVLSALLPSIAFFSPLFDVFNVFLSVLLMLCWICSLQARRMRSRLIWSFLLGLVGYVAVFFAFNLLIIGLFLVAALPAVASLEADVSGFWGRALRVGVFSSAVFVIVGVFVYFLFGYDLLSGLRVSLEMDELVRPAQYRALVSRLFNIQELMWGFGGLNFIWLSSVFVTLISPRLRRELSDPTLFSHRWMGLDSPQLFLMGQVLSVVLINLIGVLSGETSRLYALFMPFLLVGLAGVVNSLSLRTVLIAAFGNAAWIALGVWRYQFIW